MLFSDSTFYQKAVFLPAEGGYSSFLHGQVVDMLYFPIIEGYWPTWMPLVGGSDFLFFRPVFNLADSAISLGVLLLVVFQKSFFESSNSN
jgi:signal peptidase II